MSLPLSHDATTVFRSAAASSRRTSALSRLKLRRDQLPEETLRQLAAADRRVKELEEEYWTSLDKEELAIEQKCASGRAKLQVGMLEEAAQDYKAAAALRFVGDVQNRTHKTKTPSRGITRKIAHSFALELQPLHFPTTAICRQGHKSRGE